MKRKAAVTGATRGLGRAVACALARTGTDVVLLGRDAERVEAVARGIRAAYPGAAVDVIPGNIASLPGVRRMAGELGARHPGLSLLINNAGVSKFERELTREGFEVTFATNHLGPFLLSNLLADVLAANPRAMIVNVTSEQHRWVREIPWDDLQAQRRFRAIEVYNLTKLYSILWTRELARRLGGRGVAVNCVSPGFLRTDLGREATGFFRVFLALSRPLRRPPEAGAEAVLKAAATRMTGTYFRGATPAEPSALGRDDDAARRLWDVSCELAGVASPDA